ncbi:MAG: hypothetical protein M0P11_00850 [Anaerolineaceae bacterium]|nr:hypothetical protein [Anaerolineaceae bacterium]
MRFAVPAKKQPKVFTAIKAGFDTLSTHAYLLLFPILLDIYFLFGRRLLVTAQVEEMIQAVVLPPETTADMLNSWQELSTATITTFKHFSLTAFLRSYPLGIPSLLAFRPLALNPLGAASSTQVGSAGAAFLYILVFSLIGIVLGALFLTAIRMAVQKKSSDAVSSQFLRQLWSLFVLTFVLVLAGIFVLTPALLLISVFSAALPILGSVGYFFLSLIVISTTIPVFFTAHDIILYGNKFGKAARESIGVVRPTNGKTSLFIFMAIFTTYAANFLWHIPADDSWMLIISILGHGLVTTIFFIASFHFYIDARACVRESLTAETAGPDQLKA